MTTHGCGNSPRLIGLIKLRSSVIRKGEGLLFSSSFHDFIRIRQQGPAASVSPTSVALALQSVFAQTAPSDRAERFKGNKGDVMKKKLTGKLLRFLGEKLFPLLKQRYQSRSNVAGTKRYKEVSPALKHLPKIRQFLKKRLRQTAAKRL
jgi:hypothetical protein